MENEEVVRIAGKLVLTMPEIYGTHSNRRLRRSSSCRDVLHRLYELWEPQFTTSYRCSANERAPPKPEVQSNKKSKSGLGKLKVAETVVETINLMQKSKFLKGSLSRINSIGSLDSSQSGSGNRKNSLKPRSLSQSSSNS